MTKGFTPEFFQLQENLLRGGRVGQVARTLRSLNSRKIARLDFAMIAHFARRAGVPWLAVRLLNPVVRPERGKVVAPASELEKAEYAASLSAIGVLSEPLEILQGVSEERVPETLLFQAFSLVFQWRYRESIPLLLRYSRYPVDPYQKLVAQLNLAAAQFAVGDRELALESLLEFKERAARAGAVRLLGNAQELEAQIWLQAGKVSRARGLLEGAYRHLIDSGEDVFLVRKWRALCDFAEAPRSRGASEEVEKIRGEAGLNGLWETVRDIDFQVAIRSGARERLIHLYFGTPFEDFRGRLLEEFPDKAGIPSEYVWRLGGTQGQPGWVLDLSSADCKAVRSLGVKRGQLLHRLICALASDFYRPFRSAHLFSLMFPGETFNPSVPHRVHQLALRLRDRLRENRAPLAVTQSAGQYSLRATRPCGIRIGQSQKICSQLETSLGDLLRAFGDRPFSSRDAAPRIGGSLRAVQKALADCVSQGWVEATGPRSNRLYRVQYPGLSRTEEGGLPLFSRRSFPKS